MGAQKFKGKVNVPLLSQGASDLRWADVSLTNADIKALRATGFWLPIRSTAVS